jgi:hypothetical protein
MSYFIVSIATFLFNNLNHFHDPVPTHAVFLKTSMSDYELAQKLSQIQIPADAIVEPIFAPVNTYVFHFIYFALIFLAFMGLARFFKSRVKSDDHDV